MYTGENEEKLKESIQGFSSLRREDQEKILRKTWIEIEKQFYGDEFEEVNNSKT